MTEALNVGLEVVLVAVMAAVGWLVHTVIKHGNTLTAIVARIDSHAELDQQVLQGLEAMKLKLDTLNGGQQRLLERTDWLMRTADRHERFLDEGRFDRETPS